MNAKFQTPNMRRLLIALAVLALLAAGLARLAPNFAGLTPETLARVHAPNFAVFAGEPPIIAVHAAAATVALLIGAFLLLRRKGTRLHKTLGWIWVACMTLTAGSSFLMTGLNHGSFSVIHILSAFVLVMLPWAIFAIRTGRVRSHRSAMIGLYFGGLVLTGILTFIPGRLMFELIFG